MQLQKMISLWLPVIFWAGVIFTFSNFPTIVTVDFYLGDFILKKTAHLVEYGLFATLIYRALINSNIAKDKAMKYAVLASFLYGVSDEFHQSFVSGRTATLRDILIDTTGAVIAIYGLIGNLYKMPKNIQHLFSKIQI